MRRSKSCPTQLLEFRTFVVFLVTRLPTAPHYNHHNPHTQVYCCGQPTAAGVKTCLEKVTGTIYPKTGKIIWFNVRQEPNVYVNGDPVCARPPNKIGEYAELGNVTAGERN